MDSQDALAILGEVGQRERTSSTEMNTNGDSNWSISPHQQPFTSIVTNELKTLNRAMLKLNTEVKTFNQELVDLKLMTNAVFSTIEALIISTKFFVVRIIYYVSNHSNK